MRDGERKHKVGQGLRELREKAGLSQKDVVSALGRDPSDTRLLRRYEKGVRLPPREILIPILSICTGKHLEATNQFLDETAGYAPIETEEEMRQYQLGPMPIAEPQKTRWGPADGKPTGISIIDSPEELFVGWEKLEPEIEGKLLCQLGRHIPVGCKLRVDEFHGRKCWLVRIVSPELKNVGYVWFGPDPEKNWVFDGLVRVGDAPNDYEAEVWQVFQRYSDGSYRRIEAKLPKSKTA